MKQNRKVIIGITALILLIAGGFIGGGLLLTGRSREMFPADGYVLEVISEGDRQTAAGLTFSTGTQYRGKFPASYSFQDIQGQKKVVEETSYIHYSDGSLSAFKDGVTVNMREAGRGFLEFYSLKRAMVMTKAEEGWEIDNNGNIMEFPEMIWQISGDKLLAASDHMTLELPGKEPENVSGYLEVTWVDKDVVQVANEGAVRQTITSDAKIAFDGGSVLDMAKRAVLGADGEVSFTLDELQADMEKGSIAIQSESALNWTPPTFHIETVDGENGQVGKSGEGGEAGKAGETGEAGDAGETGEDGDDGLLGADGPEGAKGAVGATGASGGTSSTTGVGQVGRSLGTVRVSDLKFDCSDITRLSLVVEDDDDTLLPDTGRIEIRDAQTNRSLKTKEVNLKQEGILEEGLTWDAKDFKNILSPDREYVLLVSNGYKIGDSETTGTKTFIKRNFFTNSEGVTMSVEKVETDKIYLSFQDLESAYTGASRTVDKCFLRIKSGDYWVTPNNGAPQDISVLARDGWTIDVAALFQQKYADMRWESNIPYTIELYTGKNNSSWNMDAEGIPQGVISNNVNKSSQTLVGKTLKKEPVFGTISTSLADGYYDISVNVLEDVDNSIKNYRFTISQNGKKVEVLDSTSNLVKWYFGSGLDISRPYDVTCEVTYFDNEKDTVVNTGEPAQIYITSAGRSVIKFIPYTLVNGEWKNKENGNTVITNAWGEEGSSSNNATRIWGVVKLMPNGMNILRDQPVRIEIKSDVTQTDGFGEPKSYGLGYQRTVELNLPSDTLGEKEFYLPVKCLGLKADTTYTISVYAQAKFSTGSGGATGDVVQEVCLGTDTVTTGALRGTEASDTESLVNFKVESMVGKSGVSDRNVVATVTLERESGDTEVGSKNYFERSIARSVVIAVYEGSASSTSRTYLGTIIKDMYADLPGFAGEYPLDANWQDPNYGTTDAEGERRAEDRFYRGPLVRNTSVTFPITKDDFKTNMLGSNFDPDVKKSTVTLEVIGLCDYSYGLMEDFNKRLPSESAKQQYENYFVTSFDKKFVPVRPGLETPRYYNLMRLNKITMNGAGGKYVTNIGEVDFGEQPPSLLDPADEAVEVTELINGSNLFQYTDPLIKGEPENTVIGYKLQSKFVGNPSANVYDVSSITYYGMTLDDYTGYRNETTSDTGDGGSTDATRDIIKANRTVLDGGVVRQDAGKEKPIKFAVTIPIGMGQGDFSKPDYGKDPEATTKDKQRAYVPPLYIILTKDPDLLNGCQSVGADGVYTFTAKKVSAGGYDRAVLYTDVLPRGHAYLFAYTLRSTYHVNTLLQEKAWEFPYELEGKTGVAYDWESMQRSKAYTLLKQDPLVAAYLDHTERKDDDAHTGNKAVWQYLLYDPDGAADGGIKMPDKRPDDFDHTDASLPEFFYAGRAYAGGDDEIRTRIQGDLRAGTFTPGGALQAGVTQEAIPEGAFSEELKKILKGSFAFSDADLEKEDLVRRNLRKFTVEVTDSAEADGKTLETDPVYGITLSIQKFDDYYMAVNGEKRHYYTEKAGDEAAVALSTVTHRFDFVKQDEIDLIKDLRVEVSQNKGTDNLQFRITSNTSGAQRRMIGVYYELYSLADENQQVAAGAEPSQWGFRGFKDSDVILLTGMENVKHAAVKLWAVYDTGRAGVKLPESGDSVRSLTHNLRSGALKDFEGRPETYSRQSRDFYAVQMQTQTDAGGWHYVKGVAAVYDGGTDLGAGSAYAIRKIADGLSDSTYRLRLWNTESSARMNYRYGREGADAMYDTDTVKLELPVFKALAETPVQMAAGYGMREKAGDGYLYFGVPTAKPNVTDTPKVRETGFHSAAVEVQFSAQTVADLLKPDSAYADGKVYFSLYRGKANDLGEIADSNRLPNTGNKYFTCRNEQDRTGEFQGIEAFDNPVVHDAADGDGYIEVKANADGEPKSTYRIAVRNLDINAAYTLKMYCKMKDGSTVEVIDVKGKVEGSADEDTEEKKACARIQTSRELSLQHGDAAYQRLGYDKAAVDYSYSIASGASTDYYLEYKIVQKDADGTYRTVLDGEKLLSLLGYTREERTARYYTGAGWLERTYDVYYSKNDLGHVTPISPALGNSLHFEGSPLDRELDPGTYYIETHAYDLHDSSKEVPYQGGDNPRREFTISARKWEQTRVSVTYDKAADGSGIMNLGLPVSDPDYRLGEEGQRGAYRAVLYRKKDDGEWGELRTETLNTLQSRVVQVIPVAVGEEYRVKIEAYDIVGPQVRTLYDSSRYPLLQEMLKVPDFNAVMLGSVVSAFSEGRLTLRSSGGRNLNKVKTVDVSLTNLSTYVFGSSAGTAAAFSGGRMEIDVSGILDSWGSGSLNKGDLINISVDFKDEDGKSVEQWSGTFEY